MAGGREIKTKIKSVQNTRKVTRALEMVSASKIRKAQERMKSSRPYARAMKQLIGGADVFCRVLAYYFHFLWLMISYVTIHELYIFFSSLPSSGAHLPLS